MSKYMRATSGAPWTTDGRWIVVGTWFENGPETILFDPHNADCYILGPDPLLQYLDIWDCHKFLLDNADRPAIIRV